MFSLFLLDSSSAIACVRRAPFDLGLERSFDRFVEGLFFFGRGGIDGGLAAAFSGSLLAQPFNDMVLKVFLCV